MKFYIKEWKAARDRKGDVRKREEAVRERGGEKKDMR